MVRSQTVGLGEALAVGAVAVGIGAIVALGLKALSDFIDSL